MDTDVGPLEAECYTSMFRASHVACCSLAAVFFFPLCLGKSFLDIFTGKVLRLGADGDAPFPITERSGTPKMIQAGCFFFLKTDDLPSHLRLWPWLAAPPARHIKTRSRGTKHAPLASSSAISPPSSLQSAFPSERSGDWRHRDTACLRGPGEERLPSFAILRRKGTAVSAALSPPFVCTHGFYFDKHSTAVGPCHGGSEAPNVFAFCFPGL